MKMWLGGYHIFMKSTPRVPGDRPLMVIVYKNISLKVLGFIVTEGGGSTDPDDPCLSLFPGNYF